MMAAHMASAPARSKARVLRMLRVGAALALPLGVIASGQASAACEPPCVYRSCDGTSCPFAQRPDPPTPTTHAVAWDQRDAAGNRVGPGLYLYRITAGSFSAQRKMVLLP